jgi:hypothetical protein
MTDFTFPSNTIFDELERDFDTLFLEQVKLDLMVKIRRLVKGNLHDTQEIVCDVRKEQYNSSMISFYS